MRIIVTGTRGIPGIQGGVETHCEELYPLIADEQHEVTVIRRRGYAVDDTVKEYRHVAIKDIWAPRSKHLEALVHTFLAVLYAWKVKADIVHIHAVGPALMTPLVRLLGMKAVVTHHGSDYHRSKWNFVAKSILRLGESFGMRYASHVIVISKHIQKLIQQKYPSQKNVTLLYNGVSTMPAVEDTAYLHRIGLTDKEYILAVGRLVEEKGFDLLVEAFQQMPASPFKLVIAGDADPSTGYAEKLKKACQNQARICMTGFVKGKKLAELYTHARLFVLPSSHEGLPIVLLEAMSYGCPILASDIPANKEMNLPEDCYFLSENIPSLHQKLIAELNKMSDKTISYDLSAYHWVNIASGTKEIYNSLVSETI